jgi:GcrA cell cycle regulator
MPGFTEAEDAKLRQDWAEGHSTAEIGRRMHRSKNSIVGRAHRLGLPERPSPVRQKAEDRTVYEQRRVAVKELRRWGLTNPQVAARLGLTVAQVQGIFYQKGRVQPTPLQRFDLPVLVTPEPPQGALQSAGEPAGINRGEGVDYGSVWAARRLQADPPNAEEPMARKAPEPVRKAVEGGRTCQWPQEPWRRPWPMCGAAVASAVRNGQVVELPYCRQCALRAFHGVVFAAA